MLGEHTTIGELLVVSVNFDSEIGETLLVYGRDGSVSFNNMLITNIRMNGVMTTSPESSNPFWVWEFQSD